jgi:serine protease Do
MSSGTGFVVAAGGIILTNRHVVEGGTRFTVRLDGAKEQPAELVTIDKEQDLALLRVKSEAALPVVTFSDGDKVNEGANCYVLGFPLIDRMGESIKVTQGIVSGSGRGDVGADVVIDAKVNPGNSGGPLLDKFGRVIGIITMKTRAATFEDSYGLAIGSSKILEFLQKNNVTVSKAAPGTAALTAEDVAAKVKPATVCILAMHDK